MKHGLFTGADTKHVVRYDRAGVHWPLGQAKGPARSLAYRPVDRQPAPSLHWLCDENTSTAQNQPDWPGGVQGFGQNYIPRGVGAFGNPCNAFFGIGPNELRRLHQRGRQPASQRGPAHTQRNHRELRQRCHGWDYDSNGERNEHGNGDREHCARRQFRELVSQLSVEIQRHPSRSAKAAAFRFSSHRSWRALQLEP